MGGCFGIGYSHHVCCYELCESAVLRLRVQRARSNNIFSNGGGKSSGQWVKRRGRPPFEEKVDLARMALDAVFIGLIVFLTDAAWAMMLSTLSLYAVFLRASVALSGVIVS